MGARTTTTWVATSAQLLIAHTAVAACSSAADLGLGPLEAHRMPLGPDADRLARRLVRIRALDDEHAAPLVDMLDDCDPLDIDDEYDEQAPDEIQVAIELTQAEARCLRFAVDRFRGLIAFGVLVDWPPTMLEPVIDELDDMHTALRATDGDPI